MQKSELAFSAEGNNILRYRGFARSRLMSWSFLIVVLSSFLCDATCSVSSSCMGSVIDKLQPMQNMQKKTLSVPPLSPAFVSGLHHPRSFYSSSLSASPLSHRCASLKPFLSSRRRSTPGISQLRALAFDPNSPGKNEEERAREEAPLFDSPFFAPAAEDDRYPMDYFGESTRGDLLPSRQAVEEGADFNPQELDHVCEALDLDAWGTPKTWDLPAQPQRSVFCSRTLNMRAIRCIGYDMDYTLIHYKVVEWEGRAYFYAKENLRQVGFPVDDLEFNPELVCRGVTIDKRLGNMVKVDRFGYVRRALHGTRRLSHRETHEVYGRQLVDLREKRWLFLNTLFSVSEGCLYAQLVEKLDSGRLEVKDARTGEPVQLNYEQLFNAVSKALFKAHVEGRLKRDVMEDPEKYVEMDPNLPLTLLDQKHSGKKLALITNSDWEYTRVMMEQVMDRFLPVGMTWRDLFDVTIVSARKPAFFSQSMPLYEIVTEDGMMREKFRMKEGRIYSGGNAAMVEKLFGCESDDVMYIGDHIFTDVNLAKAYMRWRTALIVREIEEEVVAMDRGRKHTQELHSLIKKKEKCGNILNHIRTELHRYRSNRQYTAKGNENLFYRQREEELYKTMGRLLATMVNYDNQIAPMLYQEGSHFNVYWGYISRGGFDDKSHLMRQIEKYADVYTSRVSNFLRYTPYMYFRGSKQSLAHHRNLDKYRQEVPHEKLMNPYEYEARMAMEARAEAAARAEQEAREQAEAYNNYAINPSSQPPAPSSSSFSSSSSAAAAAAAASGATAQQPKSWEIESAPTSSSGSGMWGMDNTEFGHYIDRSGIPSLDNVPTTRPVENEQSQEEDDDPFGDVNPVQPR